MKLRKEVKISILVVVLLMAFYLIYPIFNVVEMQEEISSDVEIISQGIFMEQKHEVSGKALIVNDSKIVAKDKKVILFNPKTGNVLKKRYPVKYIRPYYGD